MSDFPVGRSQEQERIVIDFHVPEVCRREPMHVDEIAQEPAGQIDEVHPLIDEPASSGKLGLRAPFLFVANATAMPVPTTNVEKRTNRASIDDLLGLAERRMT